MLEDFGIFLVLADKVSYVSQTATHPHRSLAEPSRVSYRGAGSKPLEPSAIYVAIAAKGQRIQRGALLQHWDATREDSCDLHEQERGERAFYHCRISLLTPYSQIARFTSLNLSLTRSRNDPKLPVAV
jgi:hypothetical protein